MKNVYLLIITAAVISFSGCQKDLPNQPKQNQLPSTRLWLASEQVLKETSSRQHAYWYGEDPDGYIAGYLIATGNFRPGQVSAFPDTFTYTFTVRSDSIISLPLLTQRDSFTIVVRAIDNSFQEKSITEGALVKLQPQPFWDKNANGIYDGSDLLLPSLANAVDTKGAVQLLPLRNTPPRVFFTVNPIDSSTIQQPETTFTVATFSWYATDIDGDQTIDSFRVALNDTNSAGRWFSINGTAKMITLMVPRSVSDGAGSEVDADVYTGVYPNMQFRGKIHGLRLNNTNVLYLQAKDVAGEYSPPVTMPSSPATRTWYVKRPKSRMLMVGDYNSYSGTSGQFDPAVQQAYGAFFSDPQVLNGTLANFDVLDAGFGLTADDKQNQLSKQKYGSYVPSHMNPQLVQTLKLYDLVVWISDLFPSYLPAQIGLFNYTLTGGKVIFSTTFPANISFADVKALNDFAPIDSVSSDPFSSSTLHTNADTRVPAGTKVLSVTAGYPELAFDSSSTIHNFNWRRVYKRSDAQYIYRLDSSKFYYTNGQFRYDGMPEIACIDNAKKFVIVALPLHRLNGRQKNVPVFLKYIIENEFGLN